MIQEIASITIDPARAAQFEAAVASARPHFEAAKGFVSFSLKRVIEDPACYQLVVGWESVEAHTWWTFARRPDFSNGAPWPVRSLSKRPR